jgi:hypothetical protein
MQSDVWIGALITLAGAALGGAISYLLSRQQIKEARERRREDERWERARRSTERRFDFYADFLTHARQYRNAIWPPAHPGTGLSVSLHEIDDLFRAADTASTLVFLVNESRATQEACIKLMLTMGKTSEDLHAHESAPADIQWKELNQGMSRAMRKSCRRNRLQDPPIQITIFALMTGADERGASEVSFPAEPTLLHIADSRCQSTFVQPRGASQGHQRPRRK